MKAALIARKTLIIATIVMQVIFFPAAAFAEETTNNTTPDPSASTTTQAAAPVVIAPANSSTTPPPPPPAAPTQPPAPQPEAQTLAPPPPPPQTIAPAVQQQTGPTTPPGPTSPTGASASSYKLNPASGKWENDYYYWDPVTHQTTPKTNTGYSYNPSTGFWDTTQWQYDAPSGKYVPNVVSVKNDPQSSVAPSSATLPTPLNAPVNNSSNIGQLGPASNSLVNASSTNSGYFDNFFNAKISNTINSTAHSGNVGVLQNTTGGDALSGNASAMANIINMLQSTWSPGTGDISTFVANVDGNVVGDLFINPAGASQSVGVTNTSTDLQIHNVVNGEINNKINLAATSGDASVSKNTFAGDAESGTATAVGNVVNLINSHIGANQSFVGVLNINGSLDGDILLPKSFLESLIASSGPDSTTSITNNQNRTLLANFDNTQTINNDVKASAASGNAIVDKNTSAGDALTGGASTNLTIFNLTGRQVIGKDCLLVFVNVLGKWVGVIVNAPAGSNTAALGGGITQNNTLTQNTVIDSKVNGTINNDITASAVSGNAAVTSNTKAGSAKTGDANVAVNLLNISDSQLSLGGWFGVLFINVLGTWNGSFGVNTAAGNPKPPVITSSITDLGSAAVASSNIPLLAFAPRAIGSGNAGSGQTSQFMFGGSTQNTGGGGLSDKAAQASHSKSAVLAKSTSPVKSPVSAKPTLSRRAVSGFNWRIPVFGTLTGLVLFGIEHMWSLKRRTA